MKRIAFENASYNSLANERQNKSGVLALVRAWHRPTLRELNFKGLIIEEGWILPRFNEAMILISMAISVSLLGKFAFGGWEPAWGAAACAVQVATFLFFYYRD